ncbi:hypothetical protein WJX74_009809 [Apatococcus lobatus]|uniref:F-box domain-containing protein n=1 Tax=Apatococcus lobatus TaxID=904363 RepID=A0AAW1RDS2_9CHLO
MTRREELLSCVTGPTFEEIPENPVTGLVQTLVGLPLRTPPGYVPWDSDAEENVYNDLEPLKADQTTLDLAEQHWAWALDELWSDMPVNAERMTPAELDCKRGKAVQNGLLEKRCSYFHMWDHYHQGFVELLVCLLGPGDVQGALEEFLKHDAYTLVVSSFRNLYWSYLVGPTDSHQPDEAPQGLFLMRLLLRHDPAAFLSKMDDPEDMKGLKAVIDGSSSLLTVYLGSANWAAYKERTLKQYSEPKVAAGEPIHKLPTELLLAIFDCLKPLQQVFVLPQVCKRWHAIMTGPAFLWPHVTLESKEHPGVHRYRSGRRRIKLFQKEFEWAFWHLLTERKEHEAELRRSEVETPAELDSWSGLPRAWHTLGWDPSKKEHVDDVAAWLQSHRHGLPSVSLQPVRTVVGGWEGPELQKLDLSKHWPGTRRLLLALQGPALIALHLGSHLRPVEFLQKYSLAEIAPSLFPNLRQLRIGDPSIRFKKARPANSEVIKTSGVVHLLHALPQLTSLSVTCGCWEGFEGLQAMTNLTQLIISTSQYLPEVLQPLRLLTGLQRLALLETGKKQTIYDLHDHSSAEDDAEVTDVFDMSGITELTNLTNLQLDGQNYDSSCAWVDHLKALPLLRHLSMARSWYMGLPQEADDLWQLTNLQRLAFGTCQTDECWQPHLDMSKAGGMSNLTYLALRASITNCNSICELTNLVSLDFSGAHLNNFPADLRGLTRLEHLSLADMQCPFILPANISGLDCLPSSIRSVDLSHIGHVFMSRAIAGLALQPNLERVKIRHCQPLIGNMGDDIRSMFRSMFNSAGIDMTDHPHPELMEAIPEDATHNFNSYMHMMCFLHALCLRPMFGLPRVNHEDGVHKRDAFNQKVRCECGTSGQQHDAKHTVADLAMKYHGFLLEGYELWDLALPKNTKMKGFPAQLECGSAA